MTQKIDFKVRILPFLTTFAQLSARLKNFLGGRLLVLGIKEGLVKCATVCIKSVVILTFIFTKKNQCYMSKDKKVVNLESASQFKC